MKSERLFKLEYNSPRMENIFHKEFTDLCLNIIDENTWKINSCLQQLEEKDIWFRDNENTNCVGNILLHLCGNIRQYIISSLGGAPDVRERDIEFSTVGGFVKGELTAKWQNMISEAKLIIRQVSEENLSRRRVVQGTTYSGIGII